MMYVVAQEKLIVTSSTSSYTQAMLCKYLMIMAFNIYWKCSQSEINMIILHGSHLLSFKHMLGVEIYLLDYLGGSANQRQWNEHIPFSTSFPDTCFSYSKSSSAFCIMNAVIASFQLISASPSHAPPSQKWWVSVGNRTVCNSSRPHQSAPYDPKS